MAPRVLDKNASHEAVRGGPFAVGAIEEGLMRAGD